MSFEYKQGICFSVWLRESSAFCFLYAIFPVILGAIFMYLFAVGGTYFLGIHMGLLAVGAYIAMAGDECARAVGMVLRWKSGKWKSKGLVEV